MQKTVISVIAIKFLKGGTSEFIKLDPLVSKPMPDWLSSQKSFKEAQEKELVTVTNDVKDVTQLDTELVLIAKGLNIPFSADITQSKLEALIDAEKEKDTSSIAAPLVNTNSDNQNLEVKTGDEDLEAKRLLIEELGAFGVTATVKWKLETLEAKLVEAKG